MASEDLAAGSARESVAGISPPAEDSAAATSGDGLSEAEAQLYAYLDLMTNSKPQSGFPPLDELNARLNEEPYRDSLLFPRAEDGGHSIPLRMTTTIGLSRMTMISGGLSYFDHRFTELKQLLVRKDEGKREIEHIKSSLGEILTRLEQIAADMPSGRSPGVGRYQARHDFRIAGRGGGANRYGCEPYFARSGGNSRRQRPDTGSAREVREGRAPHRRGPGPYRGRNGVAGSRRWRRIRSASIRHRPLTPAWPNAWRRSCAR